MRGIPYLMDFSMGLGTSPQSESVLKHIETLYCGVVPYKIIWARRLSGPNPAVHSGHGPARHFPARREHLFRACCLGIYSNATDAGAGATVRAPFIVVLAGPSPATPKKGVSLDTWAQAPVLQAQGLIPGH